MSSFFEMLRFRNLQSQKGPNEPVLSESAGSSIVSIRPSLSLMDLLSVIPAGRTAKLAGSFIKMLGGATKQALRPKIVARGVFTKTPGRALTTDEKMRQLQRLDTGIRGSGVADTLDRLGTLRGAADAVRRSGMTDEDKLSEAFNKQKAKRDAISVDFKQDQDQRIGLNVIDFPTPQRDPRAIRREIESVSIFLEQLRTGKFDAEMDPNEREVTLKSETALLDELNKELLDLNGEVVAFPQPPGFTPLPEDRE